MSIEALAYAKQLDLGTQEGAQARLLLYVLAENTFNDTFVSRLCQAQLAYEAGRVSDRTIRRHLTALDDARIIIRAKRRDYAGHADEDAIRIVGYKRWYLRDHGPAFRRTQPDKLSGWKSANPNRTNCPVGDGSNRTPVVRLPTGQQVSGRYKDTRTYTRTSLPLAPAGGGAGRDRDGWAKGWTDAAIEVSEEIRSSVTGAHVATALLDRVRGTRNPPRGIDAPSYLRELLYKLKPFPAAVLAEVADAQIEHRKFDLQPVPDLVAMARASAARLAVDMGSGAPALSGGDPVLLARWDEACEALIVALTRPVFVCWLARARPMRRDGNRLIIGQPDAYLAHYANQTFATRVAVALRGIWPDVTRVEFEAVRMTDAPHNPDRVPRQTTPPRSQS